MPHTGTADWTHGTRGPALTWDNIPTKRCLLLRDGTHPSSPTLLAVVTRSDVRTSEGQMEPVRSHLRRINMQVRGSLVFRTQRRARYCGVHACQGQPWEASSPRGLWIHGAFPSDLGRRLIKRRNGVLPAYRSPHPSPRAPLGGFLSARSFGVMVPAGRGKRRHPLDCQGMALSWAAIRTRPCPGRTGGTKHGSR